MQAKGFERPRSRPGRLLLGAALAALALLATATAAQAMQAVAPDGSVFVAWDDVEVTRIAPDGVPSGVVYDIAPEPQLPQGPDQTEDSHLADIAVAPDGVVTLVWLDIQNWDARIMTRRLAADGTPLGEPVELAGGQEIHIKPHLGIGPDGTATVVWGRLASPGGEIVMRRIAPDGTPEEGVEALSSAEASPYDLDMAMAADGTATVVWNERIEAGGTALRARQVEPDGTPAAVTLELGSSGWAMGEPRLGVAADGTAVALWEQWEQSGEEELWTRRIEADGSLEPSARLLDQAGNIAFGEIAVAAGGSALATWTADSDSKGALIGADGTPAAPRALSAFGAPIGPRPGVAATPGDGFALSWAGSCGSKSCVRAGEVDEEGEVDDPVILDEGGAVGRGDGVFLPDGTGSYVWSKTLVANPLRAGLRTRRLAADGTLGQVYDLLEPEPVPLVQTFPDAVDFGEAQVGSSVARSVGVFVRSIEPLGTFSVAISGPDAARFKVTGTTCGAADAHPTNCSISVRFAPTGSGPATAELVVEAGEGGIPVTVPLSGEGVKPAPRPAPPPAPAPPGLRVQAGKPEADGSTGTATLPLFLPEPGTARIAGPCVGGSPEGRSATSELAGRVELEVIARSHCRQQLLRTGTTRFGVRVIFTALDGEVTVDHRPVRLWLND